ncbi:hypothetical protein C6988_09665 [Nitrosopumilus sp. b1]|nr:hypothetical protein C6988_09665 [Nitrosopumilus sp. b1]
MSKWYLLFSRSSTGAEDLVMEYLFKKDDSGTFSMAKPPGKIETITNPNKTDKSNLNPVFFLLC